jgi:hypothetical protein
LTEDDRTDVSEEVNLDESCHPALKLGPHICSRMTEQLPYHFHLDLKWDTKPSSSLDSVRFCKYDSMTFQFDTFARQTRYAFSKDTQKAQVLPHLIFLLPDTCASKEQT